MNNRGMQYTNSEGDTEKERIDFSKDGEENLRLK
jgi:hypothetical protein